MSSMMVMNGYDDCIAGVVHRLGITPILAYDMQKVLARLESQGMTAEEAIEFFEYNQIGAWVGDGTPCFIEVMSQDEALSYITDLDD